MMGEIKCYSSWPLF